jgi:hypothetical protein
MQDRIPSPGKEGRMLITPEDGSPAFYAKVEMADDASVQGTPYSTATVLSDDVAALYGKDNKAVANDIFRHLYKESIPKLGDVCVTARKDLPSCWLLCNGDIVDDTAEYDSFRQVLDPDKVSMWSKGKTVKVTGLDGYTIPSQKPCYDGTYYYICGYKISRGDIVSQHVFYSTDCKTWTAVQISATAAVTTNIIYVPELNQYCVLAYQSGRLYVYYTSNPRGTSWPFVTAFTGSSGARIVVGSFAYLNGYFIIAVTTLDNTYVCHSKAAAGPWEEQLIAYNGTAGNLIYDDSDGTTYYKMINDEQQTFKAFCSIYKDFEGNFGSYNTYSDMGEPNSYGAHLEKVGNKFIALTINGVFSLNKVPFENAATKLSDVNVVTTQAHQPFLFTIEDNFHGGYLCCSPMLDAIMRFDAQGNYVEAIPYKITIPSRSTPKGYLYYEMGADGKVYKFGLVDTATYELTYYTLDVFLPEIALDGVYAYIRSKMECDA